MRHFHADPPEKKTCWMRARTSFVCLLPVRTNERTNASFVWLVKTPRATIQAINTFKAGLDDWLMPHYYNYYGTTTTVQLHPI